MKKSSTTEFKYTKGDWTINGTKLKPAICIEGDICWPIVDVVSGPSFAEISGNMILIHAAPDMYEALLAVEIMRRTPLVDDDFPSIRDRADSLLQDALSKVRTPNVQVPK